MAIETNELIDVQTLPPFKKFIMTIGALPSSYLESMTYGELLMWFCNYLQETVIPTVNNNALAVEELQNFVSKYFDNLDVTEEINNKLDEMALDGTLSSLIDPLLNEKKEELQNDYDVFTSNVNQRLHDQDIQIQSVESGSPLVASSTAGMTDTTRVYVNTSDGNWYYYDGDSWKIGGVYQATEFSINTIPYEKTTFVEAGKNKFNKDTITSGYYKEYSSGNAIVNASFFYSDYIPVNSSSTYYLTPTSVNNAHICYYDGNKDYLSGQTAVTTLTIPATAKYMVVSAPLTQLNNIMIEYNQATTFYEKYFNKFKYESDVTEKIKDSKYYQTDYIITGKNLFNKDTIDSGYFVYYLDGKLHVNADFFASDFIKVTASTLYYISPSSISDAHICYYDVNKNFISGETGVTSFTTPALTEYIKVSARLVKLNTFMVEENARSNSYNSYFNEFKYKDKNTIYVGSTREFTTLKSAFEYAYSHSNTTIYVDPENFDILDEFGSEFFENYTSSSDKGLHLGFGMHVIFSPGSTVEFEYTGDNSNVKTYFSPFNSLNGDKGDFIVENLNIVKASGCRYAVHDDRGNDTDSSTHVFKNCIMNHDNDNGGYLQVIGGGLSVNETIIIENCIFNQPSALYTQYIVSYHNCENSNAKNNVIIKNNYFINGTIGCFWHGTSTKKTTFLVTGNSTTYQVRVQANTPESTTNNIDVYQINNVVRSS